MAGSNRVFVQEGYSLPFAGFDGYRRKKKRSGGKSAQRRKFAAAARACKGKSKTAFRACMRSKLKK